MDNTQAGPWRQELERPGPAFFRVFAERVAAPDGAVGAVREAVLGLTPALDWAGYLPHIPHGLLGLQAVFTLRGQLAEASFLRALGTQLHAFAHEARSARGHRLGDIGLGSGHWGNLELALDQHRPGIAWGEAMAMAEPDPAAFLRLEQRVVADMANVGHKAMLARGLGNLAQTLADPGCARVLLALAAWQCASEPFDRFWHERALRRLEGAPPVPSGPALGDPGQRQAGVRDICDSGLVNLLDGFSGRVRSAASSGELLAMLVLAAAEKQLDARRDLEGKTAWNFAFLAALAERSEQVGHSQPETWVQAAALVNLFPTGEVEERPQPRAPRAGPEGATLLDAILDGEAQEAMYLAAALGQREGAAAVLAVLAEAATGNDPAFNHSHQLLAVAAGLDLAPRLPEPVQEVLLVALAKFLGNSQGSSDLGRLADAALARAAGA